MRMIAAIAFVPLSDVVSSFEYLIDNNYFPEEAQPVFDYIEDTWIGRPNRRLVRRSCSMELFSCSQTVCL